MAAITEFQLKDYILEAELGRGDLTIAYRARRRFDEAVVAVKVVAPQFTFDELFVRRFKDITRQTTKLEHPNIVRTYEANQEGDVLYLVRELIEARPLVQVLAEEGPFSPQRMLTIARQIASALDYAHQKSIMHGDLSANRVYLGLNDHVTVADFGQTQAMAGTSLVKQGFAVGSPETMAPERVHGQGPSRQSDLYALGILCYQMLANEPPFTGAPAAVLHAQAYEQPQPLHIANPGISVPLSEAVGRMLAKGLELRYNTGAEFTRALAVASEGTAPVRSPTAAATKMKEAGLKTTPLWKQPWLWIFSAIFIIFIFLGFGFWAVSQWRTDQPAVVVPLTPTVIVLSTPTAAISATSQTETGSQVAPPPITLEPGPTASPTPSFTPMPTVTPTPVSFPTPGAPMIAAQSPFNNLRLARNITSDNKPQETGTSFAAGPQPVYLFFDYNGIEPGTAWMHRWTWGDTELDAYQDIWPEDYSRQGTAWVFYSPTGGYQPGPYQVTLAVNGQTVATATFVINAAP
ncbi:MAG: serine/threonine protein kinase [Anaerolineae bacterium]|nr:serine/threonine protein kinase [Anaerolineae bacterium]